MKVKYKGKTEYYNKHRQYPAIVLRHNEIYDVLFYTDGRYDWVIVGTSEGERKTEIPYHRGNVKHYWVPVKSFERLPKWLR